MESIVYKFTPWNPSFTSSHHGIHRLQVHTMESIVYKFTPWNPPFTSSHHGIHRLQVHTMESTVYKFTPWNPSFTSSHNGIHRLQVNTMESIVYKFTPTQLGLLLHTLCSFRQTSLLFIHNTVTPNISTVKPNTPQSEL